MSLSSMIVPESGKSAMKIEGLTTESVDERMLGYYFYRKRLFHLTISAIKKKVSLDFRGNIPPSTVILCLIYQATFKLLVLSGVQRKISIHSKSQP